MAEQGSVATRPWLLTLLLSLPLLPQELAGLADWEQPSGGMFLWMKLRWVGDATEVWADLQRHKLVVLPGRVMHAR